MHRLHDHQLNLLDQQTSQQRRHNDINGNT